MSELDDADFLLAMEMAGIRPSKVILLPEGELVRFHVEGDKPGSRNGAAVLHRHPVMCGWFGSWKSGVSQTWRQKPPHGETRAARQERRRQLEDLHRRAITERLRVQAATRERVARLVRAARPATDDHPYLQSKGVHAYGILQLRHMLMIVARDTAGVAHSAQFIGPDGTKRFLSGGRIDGCYYAIGRPVDAIYLAEGYSSAATVHEATGDAVAACFSCGNLKPVALALRAKFPAMRMVIAADNDAGTPGNPGVRFAFEAAAAAGALVAVPDFGALHDGE